MKTMTTHIRTLVARFVPALPIDPEMSDEALELRRSKLAAKQKQMYDQMMRDGTHLFKKGKWSIGDSRILREAGLVK